jgi:PKD repeat protein
LRLLSLCAALLTVPVDGALAQTPLFAFAQFSDVQASQPEHFARFDLVLDTLAAAGQAGALLPHPVSAVFGAGDLVEDAPDEPEWIQFTQSIDAKLTSNGIPFLAVPGNRDQDEFATLFYEQYVAQPGVWDVRSARLVGHNGVTVTTGWDGLRFVGLNNSNTAPNEVNPEERAQARAIVTAAAAGENVLLVAHHPHDEFEDIPLAQILETPGVVGYMRGHTGLPHATPGLDGIANPVWDLSSQSVMNFAALLYYEVYASEIRVYVLQLVDDPTSLPAPSVIPLATPLTPATPATAPAAVFAAEAPRAEFTWAPPFGRAPVRVAFSDLSGGHPDGWLWDFGDGQTSTERHPVHSYDSDGVYDVTFVASNAMGSDAFAQPQLVVVTSPLPSVGFTAVADARVWAGSPNQNFGSDDELRLREAESPHESYVRFDVTGIGERRVSTARLRLFVVEPSVLGGRVTLVPNAWSESSINWNNAPGTGGPTIASASMALAGSWVEFDVTSAVQGDGSYSFGIAGTTSNSLRYSSREGASPPQLVITTAPLVPALGPTGAIALAIVLAGSGALARNGAGRLGRARRRRRGAA